MKSLTDIGCAVLFFTGHAIAILFHVPTRFRDNNLNRPWVFGERLKDATNGWWSVAVLGLIYYAALVVVGSVYNLARSRPLDPVGFALRHWIICLFIVLHMTFVSIERYLDSMRAESRSFREVVTAFLSSPRFQTHLDE
jgi:hypothetical protein